MAETRDRTGRISSLNNRRTKRFSRLRRANFFAEFVIFLVLLIVINLKKKLVLDYGSNGVFVLRHNARIGKKDDISRFKSENRFFLAEVRVYPLV